MSFVRTYDRNISSTGYTAANTQNPKPEQATDWEGSAFDGSAMRMRLIDYCERPQHKARYHAKLAEHWNTTVLHMSLFEFEDGILCHRRGRVLTDAAMMLIAQDEYEGYFVRGFRIGSERGLEVILGESDNSRFRGVLRLNELCWDTHLRFVPLRYPDSTYQDVLAWDAHASSHYSKSGIRVREYRHNQPNRHAVWRALLDGRERTVERADDLSLTLPTNGVGTVDQYAHVKLWPAYCPKG